MTSRLNSNWIVGKRVDLAAFIGGALAGYLVFFMHAGLGWDMVLIYVLFLTFLDTPHFFGTYLRTYLDREEFKARRGFLLGSLLWLLAGPLTLLFSYGLFSAGVSNYMVPFNVFILGVGLWAYWHVVRQHYGFMRLYQSKNGENAPLDRRRDGWLMHFGLMLPFVVFALRHPESRRAFGLPAELPPVPSLSELGGLRGVLSGSWIGRVSWEHFVVAGCALALSALIGDFIFRQVGKWRRGEPLNGPKILLFLAVLPLHIVVCFSHAVLTAPLITFSAFVTIYHDIQYHVLVYCHQRNRFRDPAAARSAGIAAFLSRNVVIFAASAIGFGLLVREIQLRHPGSTTGPSASPPPWSGRSTSSAMSTPTPLLGAFFVGFPCATITS